METILAISWLLVTLVPINGLLLIANIQHYRKIRSAIQFKLQLVNRHRK